jgi:hypothetical protein
MLLWLLKKRKTIQMRKKSQKKNWKNNKIQLNYKNLFNLKQKKLKFQLIFYHLNLYKINQLISCHYHHKKEMMVSQTFNKIINHFKQVLDRQQLMQQVWHSRQLTFKIYTKCTVLIHTLLMISILLLTM